MPCKPHGYKVNQARQSLREGALGYWLSGHCINDLKYVSVFRKMT
jgi:hypothetical protein